MNEMILVIGTGNMGSALISGMLDSEVYSSNQILVYDIDKIKVEKLVEKHGIISGTNIVKLVKEANVIIMAVKPDIIDTVTKDIKSFIDNEKIVISIAAGKDIKSIKKVLGKESKIVRVMPNTPALIREGMSAISVCKNINEKDKEIVNKIFKSVGKVEYLDEKLMDAVIALSGSSPAYVFMFVEAMADAAVLAGIPREISYKMAAQTVMGSAKMVLETGMHPGVLKDQVCSPGGTTIEAVKILEEKGFRSAVIEAMSECTRKANDIAKGKK